MVLDDLLHHCHILMHFYGIFVHQIFGVVHSKAQPSTQELVAWSATKFCVLALWCLMAGITAVIYPPPTFTGSISSGKCHSLYHCFGQTDIMHFDGFANAQSQFPSSTRAMTTVERKVAWECSCRFSLNWGSFFTLCSCIITT